MSAENVSTALMDAARTWAAQDPDPETRSEAEDLITRAKAGDTEAFARLADQFGSRLAFGTAGLRGELGAGPNRMNRVLVAQAAAGLARFLKAQSPTLPGAGSADDALSKPLVVVGYDGRVNSDVFAQDSAAIFAGAGLRTLIMPRMVPTPVLAFAVRHLNAAAGVMVTASHNPPRDNGYKVYLGGADEGSQIVSPSDSDIAAAIDEVSATLTFAEHPRGNYDAVPESVIDAYVEATAQLLSAPAQNPLTVVYSAMHGVGWETFWRVLQRAGHAQPLVVTEQCDPDGTFPTVAFPNPEEPGALDLSIALATQHSADLIVAHDPDADRLAIAIPVGNTWRRLSGNEVGLLLGWRMAELAQRSRQSDPAGAHSRQTLACSIVSSPGLKAVADAYGLDFADTPTGFKWISRAPHLLFGFEEALGYLVNPNDVRDKDGISAAAAFLSLANELADRGLTVADHLDEFVARFGCFASAQISMRVSDLNVIADTMQALRDNPPSRVGSVTVERIDDLAKGWGSLPPSDVLRVWMTDGSRIMVRPSGTEPKLKIYIDAVCQAGTVTERRAAAESRVAELEAGMRALIEG